MAIYYHYTTSYFSRSFGHIPQVWETFYVWDEANCWNCGGEMVLERENPGAGFEFKPCWTCNGIGAIPTTLEPDYNGWKYISDYPERAIFGLYGQTNVWNPF